MEVEIKEDYPGYYTAMAKTGRKKLFGTGCTSEEAVGNMVLNNKKFFMIATITYLQ